MMMEERAQYWAYKRHDYADACDTEAEEAGDEGLFLLTILRVGTDTQFTGNISRTAVACGRKRVDHTVPVLTTEAETLANWVLGEDDE
ncbi:MAG: hypothetical protein ACYDDD_09640 [Acidithiobacillus ferrivorans]